MITHGRGYLFGLEDNGGGYDINQDTELLKVAEELAGKEYE